MRFSKYSLLLLLSVVILSHPGDGQVRRADYIRQFNNRNYTEALNTINAELKDIYSKRVENKRVPSGYISLKNIGADIDLIEMFRKRKERGFFIEKNEVLYNLHFYAGMCNSRLSNDRNGLNHLIQSLRFTTYQDQKTDQVYYEIALIFKGMNKPGYLKAYADALEQAYSLNMKNYLYSRDLGLALLNTVHKKKAIFHLTRYAENSSGEVSPEIYLKIAGLNESVGNYIETQKYYLKYIKLKPDNGEILFALGHIAYYRTGNYVLAERSLQNALRYLKKDDIYRKSKCYEYLGDMALGYLKLEKAEFLYKETIVYQRKILSQIEQMEKKLSGLNKEINQLKAELINRKDFDKYEEYEFLLEDRGNLEAQLEKLRLAFRKLNPGGVRWNIANSLEKQQKYQQAILYYRESVKYGYNANQSRDRIVKLKLKIKRGY